MIVRMKKLTVITQTKDAFLALKRLRRLGALHVENTVAPAGKDIASLKEDIESLEKAIGILSASEFRDKSGIRNTGAIKDWRFVARHVIYLNSRLDQLNEYSRKLSNLISEQEAWGDFDPEKVLELQKKGIQVKLYRAPVKGLKILPQSAVVKIISVSGGVANLAVVSLSDVDVPFKEVELPKISLDGARQRLYDNEEVKNAIKDSIRRHTCFIGRLIKIHTAFTNELDLHSALRGMGISDQVSYITGYAPEYDMPMIRETANAEKYREEYQEP